MLSVYVYIIPYSVGSSCIHTQKGTVKMGVKLSIRNHSVKMLIYTRRSPKVNTTPPIQISIVSSAM